MQDRPLTSRLPFLLAASFVPLPFAAPTGQGQTSGGFAQDQALQITVDGAMAPVTAHIRLECGGQRGESTTHVLAIGPDDSDRVTEQSAIEAERVFHRTTEVRGLCRDARGRVRHLLPETVLVVDEVAQRDSVVVLGNAERTRAGLVPLQPDEQLDTIAQAHARDMAQREYFGHISPDGTDLTMRLRSAGVGFRAAGENIGGNSSADAVVRAWLDSPGHRANLLGQEFTRIGVGVFRTPSSPYTYYVQVFAR